MLSITGASESSAFIDVKLMPSDCGTPFGVAAHLGQIHGTSTPRRILQHMSRYWSKLTPVRSNGEPTVHIGHTVGRARVQTRPCNTRYSGRPSTRSPSGAHVHERLVAFYTCTDSGYRRHQLSARGRSLGDPTSGN